MRYVAYLRVSSNQQLNEGQGLDIQEAQCRRWLGQHRHRLVEVCVDGARSGADDLHNRPGLARALALVGGNKADGILIPCLDRFARDMILQESFLHDLHSIGKELRSCSESEDYNLQHVPDDPGRALVRQVFGAFSQYERAKIRLRLRAGRERKLMLGGYAGGGPPYGWAGIRGQLVKIPDEQRTIRLIRKLRDDGASYRQIAAELERRGIPSRAKHTKWRPNTILDIVKRDHLRRPPSDNVALPSPELEEVTA